MYKRQTKYPYLSGKTIISRDAAGGVQSSVLLGSESPSQSNKVAPKLEVDLTSSVGNWTTANSVCTAKAGVCPLNGKCCSFSVWAVERFLLHKGLDLVIRQLGQVDFRQLPDFIGRKLSTVVAIIMQLIPVMVLMDMNKTLGM